MIPIFSHRWKKFQVIGKLKKIDFSHLVSGVKNDTQSWWKFYRVENENEYILSNYTTFFFICDVKSLQASFVVSHRFCDISMGNFIWIFFSKNSRKLHRYSAVYLIYFISFLEAVGFLY